MSADIDLVTVDDQAIAADQLHAHVAERLVVEREQLRSATPEVRAARLEDDVEWQSNGREVEALAFVAGEQRDAAVETRAAAQDQRTMGELEVDRALVAEAELAGAGEGDATRERQSADRGAVARVEIAKMKGLGRALDLGVLPGDTAGAQRQIAQRIASEHELGRRTHDDQRLAATLDLDLAGGEQRGVERIELAAVLASHRRRTDRPHQLGACLIAATDAHRGLVVRERIRLGARAVVRGVILGQRLLHLLDQAAGGVRVRGREMIADRLERLAGHMVILADHEQVGRLADLGSIALGRDALGLRGLPQRTAECRRRLPPQRRILAGPPDRIAQRSDLGEPRPRPRGPREVHAHRTVGLTGERIAFGREIDVARGLGRDRGPVVGREHATEERHDAAESTADAYDAPMTGRLRFRWKQLTHDLGSGLLFRPALITASLAIVGLVLIELEAENWLPRWQAGGWFFRNDPGSAQAVLGAIAGSMMSVVSIVYSVLVVALSLASVQFSPRILGGFLRDRVSQRTLGVFIGTFTYCLLVMRSTSSDPPWVATWAVAGGCLLGLTCLGFLIYFIHHIATGIQVNNLVERITRETEEVMDEVYASGATSSLPVVPESAASVLAPYAGYLQLVDHQGLAEVARQHRLVIHVSVEPGDFVARGVELARIAGTELPPAALDRCAGSFDLGSVRTMQQDPAFGIRQLVDIALKAISPAVNDPSTAATCIDRIGSLLAELGRRRPGPRVVRDGDAILVVAPQPSFVDLVDLAFNQLRQYGRGDLAVSIRMLTAIAMAARSAQDDIGRQRLQFHADQLRDGLSPSFLPADRQRFDAAFDALAISR